MNLRKVVDNERLYYIAQEFRKITRAMASGKLGMIDPDLEDKLEIFSISSGESYLPAWIRSVNKELGDPLVLNKAGLKHQSMPYWNPTALRINIYSLGIVKRIDEKHQVEVYEFVEPGGRVEIPWGYTVGGKNSVVRGVAPQLKPLPLPEHEDHGYDLSPISYLEWNTFYKVEASPCCKKQILWDEHRHACVCQRCANKIHA